jgi:DNA-binding transcriptional ArsR family regulator
MKLPRRADSSVPATAISDPVRRRTLRQLIEDDRPRSSAELSRELNEPLNSVTYHLRVLRLYGGAKLVGRSQPSVSTEDCYESSVSEDQRVRAQLGATEAKDEAAARRLVDGDLRGAT